MSQTVVVTGCAGLLGTHLSRYLLNKGYRVIGVDDLSGGYSDFMPQHSDFLFYNLNLDASLYIDHIFNKYRPIACYHFGAYAAEGLSPFIRKYNYMNNIISSASVINSCINYDTKLIFTSSMAVYGNSPPPFHESMRPNPIDPYGIAKYAVEMDIAVGGDQHGLRYNIIRPHNVVGIYQNIWDKYRNVIGIFIRKAINQEPILVYGDGKQVRAFSDIRYYMEPFYKLLDDAHNGEIFNIGADKYYTILEVANLVKKVAAKYYIDTEIKHVEPRHEVKEAFCDHSKAKFFLNFEDKTDLESLVDEMFSWAMLEKDRPVKKFTYEIEKDIYEYWR